MRPRNNKGGALVKLAIVLVVLAAIGVAAFARLQKTVRVKAAKIDTAVDAVTGSVTVDADGGTRKELKSEGEGTVSECQAIADGAKFKKGDVLLRLDTSDLDRRWEETKRAYQNTRYLAQLDLTGGKPQLLEGVEKLSLEERTALYVKVNPGRKLVADNLKRVNRMHELNNVSSEDLKNAERALENTDLALQKSAFNDRKAEIDYEAAEKNYKIDLKRMTIPAPSDGEITETSVWEGAQIGRGHVVAKFMSHDRIVTAKISEESFGKVQLGQKAKVRLLTYGDTNFDAVVSKMLPRADEAQRFTIYLDVKVERQDMLKPASTGEVAITVDRRPNAVMIPRVALFDTDKLCVVKDGRVEKRQVEVGYVNLTEAEILKGLAQGEHVVLEAPQRFRGGERVRIELVP